MKSYFIDVIPKGIQSMRVASRGKFVHKYQTEETVNWKVGVSVSVKQQDPVLHAQGVPVGISCTFVFPRPKSRKKDTWNTSKPDLTDNLFKGLIDALAGVLWYNDSQISVIKNSAKLFETSEMKPGIYLEVWAL